MQINLFKTLTFHKILFNIKRPVIRHYGQFERCKMFPFGTKEWSLVEDMRKIFSAQFSECVFQEIRRHECVHNEPIPPGECEFKVMSYNVLAQDLLDTHRELYSHHDPQDLPWEMRKHRLMEEIVNQSPDILALQEVQNSHIPLFYDELENMGYQGLYKRRTGDNTDGVAVYFKTDVFDLIYYTTVEFNQPSVKILNRPNVGLIVWLRLKSGPGDILLANTHLLYNPKRWDVRLAQTQLLLAELHRIARMSNSSPAFLFMGDFNSKPNAPLVRLLEDGVVSMQNQLLPTSLGILNDCTHLGESRLFNHDCQFSNENEKGDSACNVETSQQFCSNDQRSYFLKDKCHDNPERHQHLFKTGKLSHRFNFSSVYDLSTRGKKAVATTFHDEWVTVDYIFYSNMRLISRLRLPTVGECENFVRPMPNSISPSDHFPLIATFSM